MKKLIVIFILPALVSCNKRPEEAGAHFPHQVNSEIIELTQREMVLMNLKTQAARKEKIHHTLSLLGKAVTDENNVTVISSRVPGRLDRLFVRNAGEEIRRGQPLYSIYSEELLTDQKEYLLTLKEYDTTPSNRELLNDIVLASKQKLRLWGLTEEQIGKLEREQSPSPLVAFYSTADGYLSELYVTEGEYVESGTALFELAGSGSVWVEVQVYPYELKYINKNAEFSAEFESFPGEIYDGKVIFQPPVFEQNSKISFIRIGIENRGGMVKPGMMAMVNLKSNGREALVVPKTAVIPGEMPLVWIENGEGKFEMRMVHTGIESKTKIEILHGIREGDKVVSSGVYLVNSAYIIKHGAGAMEGMQM